MRRNKKLLVLSVLSIGIMVFAQSFAYRDHDDKPTNLKILPKDISEDDLHTIMRNYSRSLGVRCNYCHVSQKVEGQERPKWDFASDDKPEKNIARDMMRMVEAINNKYIGNIAQSGHKWEQVSCVTCHMGRTTPIISVDSIAKKP